MSDRVPDGWPPTGDELETFPGVPTPPDPGAPDEAWEAWRAEATRVHEELMEMSRESQAMGKAAGRRGLACGWRPQPGPSWQRRVSSNVGWALGFLVLVATLGALLIGACWLIKEAWEGLVG